MIKVLLIAMLLCAAVRWATGAWPWQWLSTGPGTAREIAQARRFLQVPANASHDDIRTAYRRLAAEMHPDRGGSDARLAALNAARDTLLAQLPENPR